MKPCLRIKLALPILVSLLMLIGIFHYYFTPKLLNDEKEHYFTYQSKYLDAIEHVVARLMLSGDLGELYATVDEYETANENWLQIVIHDISGKQIYPLDGPIPYEGTYIEKIEKNIYGDDEPVGKITVWIDWYDELEEIHKHVNEIELLSFVVFIVVVIFTVIWLNNLVRKPIVELEKAAHKISMGNYESKIPKSSDDEIGRLARAFEMMSIDLNRHEEELVKAKEIAEIALDAKSELLDRVTHELRTPMNAILGFAQLIHSDTGTPLDEQHKILMAEILLAGKHLLSLIDHVLELSKIETNDIKLSIEPTSLKNMIAECVTLTKETNTDNSVNINVCFPEQDLLIMVDYQRFRDVLLNILSNAIKYNRQDGVTKIAIEDNGQSLKIAISDQGEGINKEDLEKLFQPFERLGKENTDIHGIGMGLIISKRLVEMMDGSINIDSRVGEGTTVYLSVRKAVESQLTDNIAI